MSTSTWMPLYVGDFLRDTMDLNPCQVGAYLLALTHQWGRGKLPEDIRKVCQIMRLHGADASSIAQELLETYFVRAVGGGWVNARGKALKSEQDAKSLKAREKASHAARSRWKNHIAKRPSKNPFKSPVMRNLPPTAVLQALPVDCQPEVNTPSSPSQAQGLSPSSAPRKVREMAARHGAPARQAAKRQSPYKPPQSPQPTLPIGEAPNVEPTRQGSPDFEPSNPNRNHRFTPRDPRFDEMANEIRNPYWMAATGGKHGPCPWGSEEKANLSSLLQACPGQAAETLKDWLGNLVRSIHAGEYSATARPSEWLRKLPNFAGGPRNRFGDPLPAPRTM